MDGIETVHANSMKMMKVIPEKVTEKLGLLWVIDKSKVGEIVWNIFIELRDNIAFRGGRLTFIRSSSLGNHQKEQDYAIEDLKWWKVVLFFTKYRYFTAAP